MRRNVERPIITIVPLAVTQLTSEAMLGMKARRYLDWIIQENIPHHKVGKLRIVLAEVALERLRPRERMGGRTPNGRGRGGPRPSGDREEAYGRIEQYPP